MYTNEKWQIRTIGTEEKDHNGNTIRDKYGVPICYGVSEHYQNLIAAAPELLAACKAWLKVESEMSNNHSCPDIALRAQYRKEAIALTKAAIAATEKE